MEFSQLVDQIVTWIARHPDWLAVAILVTALLESLVIVGLFIPGVVFLFALGALAGSGALSLEWTLLAATIGAIAGDNLSFILGRRYSTQTLSIWPLSRYPDLIHQSERFFQQHGGKSVVIGRFVGPLRCFVPLAAGALGMSPTRFFLVNVLSALAWAPWYLLPGFLVGAAIDLDTPLPAHFYPVLGGLLFTVLLCAGLFSQLHWHLRPSGVLYQWVIHGSERYPKIQQWFRHSYSSRNDRHEYPLSSAVLALFALLGFSIFTLLTVHLDSIQRLNQWIAATIDPLHIPVLDLLFTVLTLLGDPLFLYLLFGSFVALLVIRGAWPLALLSVAGGLATHALTVFCKSQLAIARPDSPTLPDSFAYPSGHTSGALYVYGLITAFIAREYLPQRRWWIYICGGIWILLIASSRLYLQVHWFSDIVGGVLLGLFVCGAIRVGQSPGDRRAIWTPRYLAVLTTLFVVLAIGYVTIYLPDALAEFQLNTGNQL